MRAPFWRKFITEKPPHEYSGHPPVSRRGRVSEPTAHTGAGGLEFSTHRVFTWSGTGRLSALTENDLVFALSQHAVTFADAELRQQEKSWPSLPRYFAIGRTTALALHTVSGFNIHYPLDREISEVLLQLPELQNIAGKRALILRGNGGRELIGETLTTRGADVDFCECYQRSAKHYDGAEEAMRWQSRGVTTVVVTSGEMLSAAGRQ